MATAQSFLNLMKLTTLAAVGGFLAICVALALAGVFLPKKAYAASITNLDKQVRTVTVLKGDKETKLALKPQQKVDSFCAAPCEIAISGDDGVYEVEGKDELLIEEGELYLADDNLSDSQEIELGAGGASGATLDN